MNYSALYNTRQSGFERKLPVSWLYGSTTGSGQLRVDQN